MISLHSFLLLVHLLGLALGIGAATLKVVLLLRCKAHIGFVPVYLVVVKPITRFIVIGLALLTLSGIGWLTLVGGYSYSSRLIGKLILVVVLWVLGPFIDKVVEPRFVRLAPTDGATASPEFVRARQHYLNVELIATALFYAAAVVWVWQQ
jgi:hypothetical protein